MTNQTEQTFAEIIGENKHKIYRICRIYAVSPIEPQDLFQDVVIQVWKSLPSFKGKSSLSTWVYKIALNVCYSSKTRLEKKNHGTVSLDSIKFVPVESEPGIEQREKYNALKECISSLNDVEKSIVVLSLEELPYKEIAVITGLTENHIAVKMKRIKKSLLKCISNKIK